MNTDYGADHNRAATEKAPVFRHIHLSHLTGDGAPVAIRLAGLEDSPIQDVSFSDVALVSTRGVIARHVRGLSFDRVAIRIAEGPAYTLDAARDVLIRSRTDVTAGTEPFAVIGGAGSGDIRIESLSPVPPVVRREDGVADDAVIVTTGSVHPPTLP
jgi:hypothetical protein